MTSSPSSLRQRLERRLAGRNLHFLWFVFVAGLSVPFNLAARVLFSTRMPYELAVVLSHGVGMLVAFALTRAFVFGPSERAPHSELGRFLLVNLMSLAITWLVSVALLRIVFPALRFDLEPGVVAHFLGLAAASVASYMGHRHFSFGRAT
jgi:putative flippase GtrA